MTVARMGRRKTSFIASKERPMRPLSDYSKDHIGGVLLTLLGAGVLIQGYSYRLGTLQQMGAGFIPVALGIIMVLVGVAVFLTAAPKGASKPQPGHVVVKGGIDVRAWLCILGGVAAFVILGVYGGLVPATFASVFISAMGDRTSTVRGAAQLSLAMVVFGIIVFHYGLTLQLPLFTWG
jgi:hypothetical protein